MRVRQTKTEIALGVIQCLILVFVFINVLFGIFIDWLIPWWVTIFFIMVLGLITWSLREISVSKIVHIKTSDGIKIVEIEITNKDLEKIRKRLDTMGGDFVSKVGAIQQSLGVLKNRLNDRKDLKSFYLDNAQETAWMPEFLVEQIERYVNREITKEEILTGIEEFAGILRQLFTTH